MNFSYQDPRLLMLGVRQARAEPDMHRKIETLRLFVEKAERLRGSAFVQRLINDGSQLKVSWTAESRALHVRTKVPDTEETDAFLLTMRLFLQDNDPISLHRMSLLFARLPIDPELVKYYEMHRADWNRFSDEPCMMSINGDRPSRGEVLQTVLYGQLSHLNEAKRHRYQSWTQEGLAESVIRFEFAGVLQKFVGVVTVMAEICRRAAAQLEERDPGSAGAADQGHEPGSA